MYVSGEEALLADATDCTDYIPEEVPEETCAELCAFFGP
jgi:hypothetical protein